MFNFYVLEHPDCLINFIRYRTRFKSPWNHTGCVGPR